MKLIKVQSPSPEGAKGDTKSYRFDIFKGVKDAAGKIHKIKSVGSAQLYEGSRTYAVYIKTFLNEQFYLLPERIRKSKADFLILTREPSRSPGRKYYWNNVGECKLLLGVNKGFMEMSWDMFGSQDIFMNLHPIDRGESQAAQSQENNKQEEVAV